MQCNTCFSEKCEWDVLDCVCICHKVCDVESQDDTQKEQLHHFYMVADDQDLTKARWYRTYGNRRSSGWVKDKEDARVWTKKGLAQGKCTSLGSGTFLIEFVVTRVNVIDQTARLKAATEKNRLKALTSEQRRKEWEIKDAEAQLEAVKDRLEALRNPSKKHDDSCACKHCMGM